MNFENLIDNNFSGVIFIKKSNEPVFRKAFGFSDIANQIPNEADTKFATASAGKVFVAVGILQLIEKNMLSLDTQIGDVLDFDLNQIDPHITVKQLLTHTSGIPDYFDESVMEEYSDLWKDYPNYKIRTSADLIPLFINKPMMYEAGEKFQYNNTGFVVLGLIIEKITGLKFDEYLQKNIFEQCGMKGTGYYELDRLPAKCANAYIHDEIRKDYYTNIYSVDVKGTGAGGAFTTISDTEKFWTELLSGNLISKELLSEMLSPKVEENNYGYGIWLRQKEDGNYIRYFQGSDPGVSFFTSYDKEKELLVILVSNTGDNVWKLHRDIISEV